MKSTCCSRFLIYFLCRKQPISKMSQKSRPNKSPYQRQPHKAAILLEKLTPIHALSLNRRQPLATGIRSTCDVLTTRENKAWHSKATTTTGATAAR